MPQPAPPNTSKTPGYTIEDDCGAGLSGREGEDQPGRYHLGQSRARSSIYFQERAEKVAFVKGDDTVPFAEVARAIDIMRASGIDMLA